MKWGRTVIRGGELEKRERGVNFIKTHLHVEILNESGLKTNNDKVKLWLHNDLCSAQ